MSIAAVFATMNRPELAETCLRRLVAQTRSPERVVVCLNSNDDGTLARLRGVNLRGTELEILEPGENLGNAGGVQLAVDRAFRLGADSVWILDDDSWPEPDALERLTTARIAEHGLRASLVVDPASGRPSWPFQVRVDGRWELWTDISADDEVRRIRRSWLGLLLPRSVYERVGPVNGALFLRGEDEDYPRRIERAGFDLYLVPQSLLCHPPGGPLSWFRILGRTVVLEKDLSGAKLYYRLRNAWWICRRDEGPVGAVVLMLAHLTLLVWDHQDRCAALRMAWHAARDAWGNRLGRRDDLAA